MNSPRTSQAPGSFHQSAPSNSCRYFPLGSPWRGWVECPSRLYTVARKTASKLPHEWLLRTPLCGTVALAWPGVCMSIHIVRRICIIRTLSGQGSLLSDMLAGCSGSSRDESISWTSRSGRPLALRAVCSLLTLLWLYNSILSPRSLQRDL